jgi:hypothetical protein
VLEEIVDYVLFVASFAVQIEQFCLKTCEKWETMEPVLNSKYVVVDCSPHYIIRVVKTNISDSVILFSDDQKDSATELAFKYAVYQINKADNVLPNNTLVYDIQYVPPEDSFRTTRKASCTI